MTAPNELRGSLIEEGDERSLKKGDVVIVPKGTPHWFKEVDGAKRFIPDAFEYSGRSSDGEVDLIFHVNSKI